MAVNDYAIVVGINKYSNKGIKDLKGAENDALAINEWLLLEEGGNIPFENIELILSSQFPKGQPNVSDVSNIIERKLIDDDLLDCSEGRGRKGRRLYLFFAGHGITPNGMARGMDEIALLTSDASEIGRGNHISGKHYSGWFWDAALFDEIILLMDCCRDIYKIAHMNLPPWDHLECSGESVGVHSFYAFSSQFSQSANEGVVNGVIRGYFSAALSEGLKYAVDEEGRVTAKSLKKFIYTRMQELQEHKSYQEPDIMFYPSSATGKEIIFCEPGISLTASITILFKPKYFGCEILIMDGSDFREIERITVIDEEWHVNLPIGKKYLIAQKDNFDNKKIINVIIGEEYHVDF